MKKQRFFMLGIITVLVAVLSLTFVSSTFAKYTSAVSGSDQARVAKWDVIYKGESTEAVHGTSSAQEITFDLFNTILDSNGSNETDVNANLIAPGTKGSFKFVLQNNSEVSAKYEIKFTVTKTNANIPLTFTVKKDGTAASAALDTQTGVFEGSTAVEYTIDWAWAFEQSDVAAGDAVDTNLGVLGTDTITVKVEVIFTQID